MHAHPGSRYGFVTTSLAPLRLSVSFFFLSEIKSEIMNTPLARHGMVPPSISLTQRRQGAKTGCESLFSLLSLAKLSASHIRTNSRYGFVTSSKNPARLRLQPKVCSHRPAEAQRRNQRLPFLFRFRASPCLCDSVRNPFMIERRVALT